MNKQIEELKSYLDQADVLNEKISIGKVGWHIHHCFNVMNWAGLSLVRSKPENFTSSFNLTRLYIFSIGRLPKGKMKVPSSALQSADINAEIIEKEIQTAERMLEKMEKLPANSFMKHPVFGALNVKQSKRFVRIHTEHHLKIIREILK